MLALSVPYEIAPKLACTGGNGVDVGLIARVLWATSARPMQGPSRHVIVAMGVSSALGDSLEATWASVTAGIPIVRPPEFALPFPAVCGAVDGPLEPLTGRFARYDTRLTRIALRALAQVMPAVERARARYGRERIGVLVGTSTGGLDTTAPA